MLKKINALPSAQRKLAIHDWYRKLYLRESCFQMSGHVVESFVIMLIRPVVWSKLVEIVENVALYGGVGILLNQQRSRGVPAENREEAGLYFLA